MPFNKKSYKIPRRRIGRVKFSKTGGFFYDSSDEARLNGRKFVGGRQEDRGGGIAHAPFQGRRSDNRRRYRRQKNYRELGTADAGGR